MCVRVFASLWTCGGVGDAVRVCLNVCVWCVRLRANDVFHSAC